MLQNAISIDQPSHHAIGSCETRRDHSRRLPEPVAVSARIAQTTSGYQALPSVLADRRATVDLLGEIATGSPAGAGLVKWQINKVVAYIDERITGANHLNELAAVVRLSTSHFSRAFRISLGETPHRFVMRRRIERAQEMMLTTNDKLSQIAYECGLTDQAHLTRLFRRFVGDTPRNWRHTQRQKN